MLVGLKSQNAQVAQTVKNLLVMQETRIQSVGWEDSLGGGHGNSLLNILAWRMSWTEEPWWATVHGVARSLT